MRFAPLNSKSALYFLVALVAAALLLFVLRLCYVCWVGGPLFFLQYSINQRGVRFSVCAVR